MYFRIPRQILAVFVSIRRFSGVLRDFAAQLAICRGISKLVFKHRRRIYGDRSSAVISLLFAVNVRSTDLFRAGRDRNVFLLARVRFEWAFRDRHYGGGLYQTGYVVAA